MNRVTHHVNQPTLHFCHIMTEQNAASETPRFFLRIKKIHGWPIELDGPFVSIKIFEVVQYFSDVGG